MSTPLAHFIRREAPPADLRSVRLLSHFAQLCTMSVWGSTEAMIYDLSLSFQDLFKPALSAFS